MEKIVLTGNDLSFEGLYDISFNNYEVEIAPEALKRAKDARNLIFRLADEGYPVYGLNRGVGWNKDKYVFSEFFEKYNKNLLNTHALGMLPCSTEEEVRAMMAVRLNTALCGSTGISIEILEMLKNFLNKRIHPVVPRRGSIGNADLATLAHVGLAIIGEGDVVYKGERVKAIDALRKEGLSPAKLGPKDGLGIVSSNAHAASMAALLVIEVEKILKISNMLYCLGMEGLNGVIQPLDPKVNELRGFDGQISAAAQCRTYLEGSYLYKPHDGRALQDALCYRSAFTVNGSVIDALEYVKKFLLLQLNRTDDNPCIIADENRLSVSSNFEPTTWAVGLEMLNISLNHLSKMICYRMIKLGDPYFTRLNRFLSPKEGETLAFATFQKAYTSLNIENRSLANPSSLDYFALAGGIEDHACACTLVVEKGMKIVDNIRYMLGMEAIHCAQAIDLRKKEGDIKLGKGTQALYYTIREVIPFYDKDRCLSTDIQTAYELILSDKILKNVEKALND